MCGIFGTTLDIDAASVASALELLAHRGPDSNGTERYDTPLGKLTFVHTRLAIQDLSANGHQPMSSRDGRWHLTFNGELYNHPQLRKNLAGPFRGNSDTETLIETIAAQGIEKTLPQLNGLFAFAAYDAQQKKLYLVRDPFGIKPLYVVNADGRVSFSSEIKPLIAVCGQRPLNAEALSMFLSLRYTVSPDTLLAGIERLPPAHCMQVDLSSGQSSMHCYSSSTRTRFSGSQDDAVERYHEELRNAVHRQMISDVPVGVLLSGGIDSALVAMHARDKADITGYTVGFGNEYDADEVDAARETADVLGIEHRFVNVDPKTLIHDLDDIVRAVEEPLGTTSIMPMWHLVQLAKQDVTVALTGQGSDEPWGGYKRYQLEHVLARLPFLKSSLFKPLTKLASSIKDDGLSRGLSCLGVGDQQIATRFLRAYELFTEEQRAEMLRSPSNSSLADKAINRWLNWLPDDIDIAPAEKMMRIDSRMNLADDLLLYGDKTSMSVALEARVPMLDIDLVEFIESLPLAYRSGFRQTKVTHKLSAERFLPESIVNRPKKGFLVPFGEWSRGVWRASVSESLLDSANPVYEYLNRSAIENLWNEHLAEKRDHSRQLFALLTLSIWARHFLTER